jgi:hypothetical protein
MSWQAGLSCALLVAAYIVQQRLQPFLTTKPLSARLKLTPSEILAILSRDKKVGGVDAAQARGGATPGTSVVRRRTRGVSALALPDATPGLGQAAPGQARLQESRSHSDSGARVRRNIVHLARHASARTLTRSLNFVINFNHLVGATRKHFVCPGMPCLAVDGLSLLLKHVVHCGSFLSVTRCVFVFRKAPSWWPPTLF